MHEIVGYGIDEQIHGGRRAAVYRGRRERDGLPVIVKVLEPADPHPGEVARFKRAFAIGAALDGAGVVRFLALAPVGRSWAIVMEDTGARSLRATLAERRLPLDEVLRLGADLAARVAHLHQRHVIHHDVSPAHVVVHPVTGEVSLIDLGLATRLPRAPAPRGRGGRGLDHRADLQALGLTLHEMLTGRPRPAGDAAEAAPRGDAAIPGAVAAIVTRLCAPRPPDRYQTAAGLEADLRACLPPQHDPPGFAPGAHDVSDRLHLPEALYGRAAELETLLETFDRVRRGRAEVVLLGGAAGVGKRALVHELRGPVLAQRGHLCAGTCERRGRDLPYAPLVEAFTDLVEQLRGDGDEAHRLRRERLASALGACAGVIAAVIPAVTLLVGEAPPPPPLPPAETRARLAFAFGGFVRALAAEPHPLVLFLDDLQWADRPSLELLHALLARGDAGHLLVVAAHRPDDPAAPRLERFAADLAHAGVPTARMTLGPLGTGDVEQIVARTFCCDRARAAPLARLVADRSGGNPFHLGQLLAALHEDRLVDFDPHARGWRWDLDAIRARGPGRDVAALPARRIDRLSPAARAALERAAALGDRFELDTLAIAHDRTPLETAADLDEAVNLGLVLPLDEGLWPVVEPVPPGLAFRFGHDRLREAVYARIPAEARGELHRGIGDRLLAAAPEPRGAHLLAIAHQLALGHAADRPPRARAAAAALHLRAAREARAAAAFAPARRHLEAGVALLGASAWSDDHALAFALHTEAMEAQLLTGAGEAGEARAAALLEQLTEPLERARVHELRAAAALARGDRGRARAAGDAALALLDGVAQPAPAAALAALGARLGERGAAALLDLPLMTDPTALAAVRVVAMLLPTLRADGSPLHATLAIRAVELCLDHGHAPEAPYLYATLATLEATLGADAERAAALGRAALALVDRLDARRFAARVRTLVGAFVMPGKDLRGTIPLLTDAVRAGLETGDLESAGHAAGHACSHRLHAGEPLESVLHEHDRHLALLDRHGLGASARRMRVERQACLRLMGRAAHAEEPAASAEPPLPDEAEEAVLQTMLAYLFHDHAAALAAAEAPEPPVTPDAGLVTARNHGFYRSLALLAACADASPEDRARYLARVDAHQEAARRWAASAPAGGRHRVDLVEAERARGRGDHAAADGLYEDAARGARQAGYVQDEGLAHELAGAHHLALGRERQARDSLLAAAAAYRRWGATALVAEVLSHHAEALQRPSLRPSPQGPASGPPTDPTPLRGPVTLLLEDTLSTSPPPEDGPPPLDLRAVLKAALAVSGEIELDRLLDNLLRFCLESTGADRGFLVLERAGALVVAAQRPGAGEAPLSLPRPLSGCDRLAAAIVQQAARSGASVVLDDAAARGPFVADPYVARLRPRSLLCAPLWSQGRLVAVVYLENNREAGAFTEHRLEVLRLVAAQAVVAIKNAVLHARLGEQHRKLEEKLAARAREIAARDEEIGRTLRELRDTQAQLVAQEKLASLGALTAGIAHEIKNPLNFVANFAELSSGLADDLAAALDTQRARMDPEVVADLDDALSSLRFNVTKINEHGRRANHIINGMLRHAREGAGRREPADLNALLAESISLAYHGMRGRGQDFNLAIDAQYDAAVGLIEMVSGDVSRVFVNLINNACYSMAAKKKARGEAFAPRLVVRTRSLGERVEVRLRDNGNGVPAAVLARVWNPFFTTKPSGEGTGLGLSISHDIIAGAHQGSLTMDSVEGEYAEVVIQLPRRAVASAG
jgi:predicted ATPase/signal transduction histidine kinase